MIKCIIFDMDGTLIDTNNLIIECISDSVQNSLGYKPSLKDILDVFGKPLSIQMNYFSEEHSDEMVEHYRKVYRARRDIKTFIFDDIISMLEELHKRDIKMAIVSNKGRSGIDHALEKFDMGNYFEISISKNDVINNKPDPEGVQMVLDKLKLKPEECLFVGDSDSDIGIASNSNIKSVLVGWTKSNVKGLEADYFIEKPMDLLDLLN